MSNSSFFVVNAVSIPLAGVSTIACIIALGVLLYYKMWRSFIYRLVLYMFSSLIFTSLSTIILMISYLRISSEQSIWLEVTTWTNKTGLYASLVIPSILLCSFVALMQLLVTYMTVSIYLMALHNYQFTYKSDLRLLALSIIFLTVVLVLYLAASIPPDKYLNNTNKFLDILTAAFVLVCFLLPINIVFTALTLVPLCCRACGYNLCTALREIIIIFIFNVPSFLFYVYMILSFLGKVRWYYGHILCSISGLVCALFFGLHLCFVKKNLQGKNKTLETESMRCSHRTEVFTSEGTCNTEHLPVVQSEEDTRYLLLKNDRVH